MLKSAYWPWRRCHFMGFSIFSSCGHFVQQSGTIWAMFLQGPFLWNYFKIGQLALEEMSFYEFSIFSSAGHFVQQSRTILAIFDKLHQGIIRMKLFWNGPIGLGEDVVLRVFSIFSSGGHFVQQSRTILAILVKGHPRNIPVKLFWNLPIGLGGDVV